MLRPGYYRGRSGVACYTCILRILRGEEPGLPFKPFFVEFRKAFRKATAAWLLLLLILVIFAGDYYYAVYVSSPVNNFFLVFSLVMAAVIMLAVIWLFPLMARYENTVRGYIKNSFLMAVAVFPKTFLALAIQVMFILLPILIPDIFTYIGWLWALVGLSLPMYITATIFRKQLDSEPKKNNPDGQD